MRLARLMFDSSDFASVRQKLLREVLSHNGEVALVYSYRPLHALLASPNAHYMRRETGGSKAENWMVDSGWWPE